MGSGEAKWSSQRPAVRILSLRGVSGDFGALDGMGGGLHVL